MHEIEFLPKIDLHLYQHHQFHLEEEILKWTTLYIYGSYLGHTCMSIDLVDAPMSSPPYMNKENIKKMVNLLFICF